MYVPHTCGETADTALTRLTTYLNTITHPTQG